MDGQELYVMRHARIIQLGILHFQEEDTIYIFD